MRQQQPCSLHVPPQDGVDSAILAEQGTPPMQTVLGGSFAQQVIARGVDFHSEREEEFCGLSVDVRGKPGLIESLEAYVQGELMEGDNQYYCEQVNKKVCGGVWNAWSTRSTLTWLVVLDHHVYQMHATTPVHRCCAHPCS